MPWSLGLKILPSLDDCSALFATAPLVWVTSTWDGGGTLANLGYAGPAYDLAADGSGGATLITYPSGPTPWANWGGEPGDEPLTFLFALNGADADFGYMTMWGPDTPSGSTALGAEFETGFDFSGAECFQMAYGQYGVGGVHSFQDNQPTIYYRLYSMEFDVVSGVVTNRVNNTYIPPDPGYDNTYGGSLQTLFNSVWGTASSQGYDFEIFSSDGSPTPGLPWDGIAGMALVRGLLTDDQRARWYECLSGVYQECFDPVSNAFDIDSAIWDGARYIAVDTSGTTHVSTDFGQTWTTASAGVTLGTQIASNKTRIVSATNQPAEVVKTSDNGGTSWTDRATLLGFNFPDVFNATDRGCLACHGTGFALCGRASTTTGNNVYYSSSGTTWTGVHVGPATTTVNFSFIRNLGSTLYMAGSDSGTTLLYKSIDGGVSWSALTAPAVAVTQFPFMWIVDNKIVYKTENSGTIRLWSSDNEGSSWTEHTHGLSEIIDVVHDGTQYIVMDANGNGYAGDDLDSLALAPSIPTDGGSFGIVAAGDGSLVTNDTSGGGNIWALYLNCPSG